MLLLISVSVFLLREDDFTAYVGHVVLIWLAILLNVL